tara:strand:+ start:338 stop:529 length:192 start_codon:yes stop_codon:yes gene_type:complete
MIDWMKKKMRKVRQANREKYDTSENVDHSGLQGKDFKGMSAAEIARYNRKRAKQKKDHKEKSN